MMRYECHSHDDDLDRKIEKCLVKKLYGWLDYPYSSAKVLMDTESIRAIPFVGNDEFSTIDEAIGEAGGSLHVVSWRVNAGTYKALAKNAKHHEPCCFGAWTVEVRGIAAKRWTNNATGDSWVTFKFVGLRPVGIEDGEEPIRPEDLETVDRTTDEDND